MKKILLLGLLHYCTLQLFGFTVSHNRYTYPTTNAGSSSSFTLTIRGDQATSLLSVSSNNPLFEVSATTIRPDQLSADKSYALVILFKPTAPQTDTNTPFTGIVTISEAATGQITKINLTGTSLQWQASLSMKGSLLPFHTVLFTPSQPQTVILTGEHQSGDIQVKVPSGFEVSRDQSSYVRTLAIAADEINGTEVTLYVRLNATFVNSFRGNMTAEGAQYTSQTVALMGTIQKATPTLVELPIVTRNLTYGEPLGNAPLEGGTVTNSLGEKVKGSFRWVLGDDYSDLTIGQHELPIYFAPDYSYGYETLTASIFIRVLPAEQQITWEQTFATPLKVGEKVELTATASSLLPIRYEINYSELATIETGTSQLTALTPGRVRVSAFQDGNANYQPARGIAYYIEIIEPSAEEASSEAYRPIVFWNRQTEKISVNTEKPAYVHLYSITGAFLGRSRVESNGELTLPAGATHTMILLLVTDDGQQSNQKILIGRD